MTYLTEKCSECDLEENMDRYLMRINEAEAAGDWDMAKAYRMTVHTLMMIDTQLCRRAHHGYTLHGKNYINTGDLEEIDRMLRHPMPDDDFSWQNKSKRIKIIPLEPKSRGMEADDTWMETESTGGYFSGWNIIAYSCMFAGLLLVLLTVLFGG